MTLPHLIYISAYTQGWSTGLNHWQIAMKINLFVYFVIKIVSIDSFVNGKLWLKPDKKWSVWIECSIFHPCLKRNFEINNRFYSYQTVTASKFLHTFDIF